MFKLKIICQCLRLKQIHIDSDVIIMMLRIFYDNFKTNQWLNMGKNRGGNRTEGRWAR